LCASRPTSSFSPGPATESIALFTESELPQVEKNVWSACTASAISACACSRTSLLDIRSSSPEIASTSDR
jgi:hypothetical protein